MSGDYFQYIVSNAVCILIFGIMLVHDLLSIDRQEKQIKFDRALIPFMAYFLFDAFWAAVEGEMLPLNIVSVSIVDFALVAAIGLITYAWLRYALAVEQVSNREKLSFRLITIIPFFAFLIGLVITYFVNRNAIYDANLKPTALYYVFMNGSSYLYLIAILVYTIRRAIKEKSHIERRQHLVTGFLPLMVVIGGVFQLILPKTAIFCFSATFLMLIFYIQSMQGRISLDPLTKLNNRGELARYISQESFLRKEHKLTFVIMIDINDFKQINDTYGHASGDKGLVILSDVLHNVAAENKVSMFVGRYGGDEFVIIAHPNDESEIDTIVASIRDGAEMMCHKEGTPFILSLGIGYEKLGEGDDTFQSCFERTDKKLYINKEQVKRAHLSNQPNQNNRKPRA